MTAISSLPQELVRAFEERLDVDIDFLHHFLTEGDMTYSSLGCVGVFFDLDFSVGPNVRVHVNVDYADYLLRICLRYCLCTAVGSSYDVAMEQVSLPDENGMVSQKPWLTVHEKAAINRFGLNETYL